MATTVDYDNRVSNASWKLIKDIIPSVPEKNNTLLPPEFGYVVDYLRETYKIYISVSPRTNTDLENVSKDTIFEWVGDIFQIDKNKIIYKYTISANNYVRVIRNCIDKAVERARTLE